MEPLLKKPGLDPSVLQNFHPISKHPFIAKILEKVVFRQLSSFLAEVDIMDKFQSGFRTGHSTEFALIRVLNYILLEVDSGNCVGLVLLDLSAVFDTLDHFILLERLERYVGVSGVALSWFHSYLEGRTFTLQIGNNGSSAAPVSYGVPQGSILGQLLFSLYMIPLGSIFNKFGISYHSYADDTRLYLGFKAGDNAAENSSLNCLEEVKCWMNLRFKKKLLFGKKAPHLLRNRVLGSFHPE